MISSEEIVAHLKADRSKKSVSRIVELMARQSFDFSDYIQTLQKTELPVKWHMTWTLSHYLEHYPRLNQANQIMLWTLLKATENDSMLRDLWRCFALIPIDDEIAGDVFDRSLLIAASQARPVAIRVHAMQCAYHICKNYPDLAGELREVLREVLDHEESAAMISRGKRLIKALDRLRRDG